jgi:hypothetical protein
MKINIFGVFFFFCGFSTQFPSTISKASSLCSANLFKPRGFKVCRPCFAWCKKSFFLHFKCYNLAIYVVNFLLKKIAPYFNIPKLDPIVEFQKNKFKNKFMQFALKVFFSKPIVKEF